MIAILEWTQSKAQQNTEQLQTPTTGVTINKKSTTTEPPPYKGQQPKPPGAQMHPTCTKSSPQILLLLKHKKCPARMEAIYLMQCNSMENTLIKLTHHDETKKRAHDSHIVRAKENLKLSHHVCKFNSPLMLQKS